MGKYSKEGYRVGFRFSRMIQGFVVHTQHGAIYAQSPQVDPIAEDRERMEFLLADA
jgi:hypothetical protein